MAAIPVHSDSHSAREWNWTVLLMQTHENEMHVRTDGMKTNI